MPSNPVARWVHEVSQWAVIHGLAPEEAALEEVAPKVAFVMLFMRSRE
jgi:hypothetical protein